MSTEGHWRDFIFTKLLFAGLLVLFSATLPLSASAQGANHEPLIATNPTLVVTTDSAYTYEVQATDRDGNEITYSLTEGPSEMSLVGNAITWQPELVGSYNVVIGVSDSAGGFDSQSWQIAVLPGSVAKVAITPNDKPTAVNLGDTESFSATTYDRYDNAVNGSVIAWSTDTTFGSIDHNGVFNATKGGITYVEATVGDAQTMVGVVVVDIRPELVAENEQPTNGNTNTAATNSNSNTNAAATNSNTNTNANGETISPADGNANSNTNSAVSGADQNASEPACSNIATWLAFLILAAYAVVVTVYFRYEQKHRSASWWIFPLLLSVIGLIMYYKNFCSGTFVWWPWILLVIGVVLSMYYRMKKNSGSYGGGTSQTELPF